MLGGDYRLGLGSGNGLLALDPQNCGWSVIHAGQAAAGVPSATPALAAGSGHT